MKTFQNSWPGWEAAWPPRGRYYRGCDAWERARLPSNTTRWYLLSITQNLNTVTLMPILMVIPHINVTILIIVTLVKGKNQLFSSSLQNSTLFVSFICQIGINAESRLVPPQWLEAPGAHHTFPSFTIGQEQSMGTLSVNLQERFHIILVNPKLKPNVQFKS